MSEQPNTVGGRMVLAAVIGNFIEWYDFSVYAFFATTIGTLFFPSGNPTASLLASFAAFGVAFLARPLGALVFGRLGDRIGRTATMAIVVLLMSGATAVLGLLPPYSTIGVAAPLLLLLVRILQGLSAGGEYASASSYLVESAPERRKGLTGSWTYVGIGLSIVLGSALGLLLNASLSADALSSWGWRLPFLIAAPLGAIGFYLRSKVEDSAEFLALRRDGNVAKNPLRASVTTQLRNVALAVGIVVIGTVLVYVALLYLPTYLAKVGGLSATNALLVNLIGLVVFTALVPLAGRLSDSLGRKPLLLVGTVFAGVAAYPAFLLISQQSMGTAVVGQLLLALPTAIWCGVAPTVLVELFPVHLRASALSVGYSVAVAVFGGFSPFVITYLISVTDSVAAPAIFVACAAVLSLIAMVQIRDTAPRPTAAG